jgi:hypothetical protein
MLWLFAAIIVALLWIFRDKFPGGGGGFSGPDPAPTGFPKGRRKRIIDWWQRWP